LSNDSLLDAGVVVAQASDGSAAAGIQDLASIISVEIDAFATFDRWRFRREFCVQDAAFWCVNLVVDCVCHCGKNSVDAYSVIDGRIKHISLVPVDNRLICSGQANVVRALGVSGLSGLSAWW